MLEITEIRVHKIDTRVTRRRAWVSVLFCETLLVHGFSVMSRDHDNALFVAWPADLRGPDYRGHYKQTVCAMSTQTYREVNRRIMEAYHNAP